MNLKSLSIAVAILFLASVAVFLANRPAKLAGADPRVGKPIVSRDVFAKAARITIDDSGKSVVIARDASGNWNVASYYGLPADFSKLTQLADQLLKAKVDRFVTANPERIARYEFGHDSISLADDAGKPLWTLELGKTTDNGGRLIRFGGDTKVFLSRMNAWLDSESKNWADTTLVSLKMDDIADLTVEFPGKGLLELARPAKGAAFVVKNPAGEKRAVDGQKVDSLLSSVTTLRFSDTDDPKSPAVTDAEKTSRWVALRTFEGATWRLTFSRKPVAAAPAAKPGAAPAPTPTTPVYLHVACSDAKAPINGLMEKRAYQIYDYTYTSLPKSADDLLVAPVVPPKPAGAPTAIVPAAAGR